MNQRTNKGITLISLVITIIVLLILAGIVISLTIGENGIINKSETSGKTYELSSIKEQIQMEILGRIDNDLNVSNSEIEEILEKYAGENGEVIYEDDKQTIPVGVNPNKYPEDTIWLKDIWNGNTVEDTKLKVANEPNISGFNQSNTYYTYWTEDENNSDLYNIQDATLISQTPPNDWYDYTDGVNKWANIKTTGGENDCYWVWIPRYAYKVPTKGSTAETIEVKFLKGKTNVPIGETEEITNTTPTVGLWVVHPAFTFGDQELTGIWVAKFEASSSSSDSTNLNSYGGGNTTSLQVRVIPNVTSWRNITVNNMFTVCRNIQADNGSLDGVSSDEIDSHMMKNIEWGACAYLSRSVYGKNAAVWNNSYYNNETYNSIITGLAGTSQEASTTAIANTHKYNTKGGIQASTSRKRIWYL